MCKLTKTITQNYLGTDRRESDLNIVVEFDPNDNSIDSIEEIYSYNWKKGVITDLTAIFTEQFPNELEAMVDSIDWLEVYNEITHEEEVCHD